MASQISHVVVNRVIGMARHRSQVAQNLTMKSYSRVRLKGSFLNAEKSKPQGLQIPFFLNIKLERNTHFLRSNADRLHPFTAFGVRLPFGCELSNSRMPVNVFNNGLTGGACSFSFGSTTRLFSQISKMGTQHNVVCTQGKANGTNYLPKQSDKRLKSPKAFAAEKNEVSTHELASKGSQSKDNGTNYLHKTSNERLKSPTAFAAEKNEASMHELASKGSQRKDNGTNYLHKTSNKCLKSPKAFATEKNEASMHELASKGSQCKDNGTNYLHKTSNKCSKSPRAFGAKKNETSVHELESNWSQGKVADSKDVKLSSLNGAKADENFFAVRSTQTPKGKDQGKQRPRSKRKQNQSLSSSASKADGTPGSSTPNIQAKESKNNKSKQSHSSLKINSASSTQKEATHNNTSTKTAGMEAVNLPANKGNNNTHSSSRSDEKHTVQSGNKVSAGGESPHNRTMSRKQKTWPQLYPPITKSVVVVESVAKADIIQAYLGEMFEVLPSYGHVRDLAARSGSVRPDDDFSMVWEVPSPAWSHLKSIKVALSGAENLILASDPDREGEAIAWHIIEMLKQQDALREDVTVARVTFNEITEPSIKSALQSPRAINLDLVHAYLSRRALDYLIGFNVSPLLWRKLPGCQSAGPVQSAALALICDREKEINDFKAQEYWTINAHFQMKNLKSANNVSLPFHLIHFDSKNLQLLSISSNTNAKGIEEKINLSKFEVNGAKPSKIQKKPPAPYMTASLLQDAANKFNFTGSHTMKIAQKLYEGVQLSDGKATGLITYMRTDGFHISDEAAKDIQSFIRERYGLNFTSKSPRKYFKKVKNAEEAHEAIRPTDIRRLPSMLAGLLDEDSLKLYTLVWARTMACQMEPAVIEQIQCDVGNVNQSIMFRASSSRVGFPGFQAVYQDAEARQVRDNEDEKSNHNETFKVLSNLQRGKPLSLIKVESEQHYTQPPPRYSEGSLVKKLEELGMGRPSTYATTIKVLKDRNYIKIKSSTIYPEFRGCMVSAFLSHYFSEVSDYSFTADMETEIDNVSAGTTEWKGLLKDYWSRFSKYCESANKVHVHSVEKIVEKALGNALFSSLPDGDRTCPSCLAGTLAFKVGRFGVGYFIACDQLPQCKYIAKTLYGEDDDDHDTEDKKRMEEPTVLGICPGTNEKVLLKCGPFGHYVQLGEDRKGHLPKRASLAHIKDANSITLEDALDLLQYPVTLGKHPDDNHPVILRLGRFGFAVKHRRSLCPVPKNLKPSDITIEKAFELLRSKDVRKCGRPKRQPVVAAKAV